MCIYIQILVDLKVSQSYHTTLQALMQLKLRPMTQCLDHLIRVSAIFLIP